MPKGLMLLMGGKPKGKPHMMEDDEESSEDSGGGESLAGEAFDALQDGDRAGFVAAFKAAVKACAGAGEYEDEDDDAEGF